MKSIAENTNNTEGAWKHWDNSQVILIFEEAWAILAKGINNTAEAVTIHNKIMAYLCGRDAIAIADVVSFCIRFSPNSKNPPHIIRSARIIEYLISAIDLLELGNQDSAEGYLKLAKISLKDLRGKNVHERL